MYEPRISRKRKNVPILSKKDIDFHAERYVDDFDSRILQKPQPLDIDRFAEQYLNLILDYQFLSCDGRYLGMTVFNDTNKIPVYIPEEDLADYIHADPGTIIIDNQLLVPGQEHRYRFTLGHECGHWIYHRAYFGFDPYQMCLFEMSTPYINCREINRNYLHTHKQGWDSVQWIEWQADQFAAGILMPASSVRSLFQRSISSNSYLDICHAAKSVSNLYDVSEQAAYLRLRNLDIIETSTQDNQYEQLSFL